MNWGKVRSQFPVFERRINGHPLAYLDSAATSQKPQMVIDAVSDFYSNHNANVHRGRHTLSDEASDLFDAAHQKAAALVNAPSMSEIAMTSNATAAINTVSNGLAKKGLFVKGDEIVVTGMEHHANLVPWILLAQEQKLKLRVIPLTADGQLDYATAEKMISKRTKLVAVSHASNILGTINDASRLCGMARDAGAVSLVDACQAVPHFPVDVKRIGCDFLAWSAHKMCGPTGVGVLYGREEALLDLPPMITGGEMISEVHYDRVTWNKLPWRFEAGTPAIAEVVGFGAAIDFLRKIGFESVAKRDLELGKKAFDALSTLDGVTVLGPSPLKKVSLFSFDVKGIHPHDVATVLDNHGIAIRSGNHCAQPLLRDMGFDAVCRASLYLYSQEWEIDALVNGILKTQKMFDRTASRVARGRGGVA